MTSVRYQLERALWQRGLRVGVLAPNSAPSVDVFPVVLPDNVEAEQIERKLNEITGRLGITDGRIRGAWLPSGNYSLELPRAKRQRVDYERLTVDSDAAVPWLLGINNQGDIIVADVADMPHKLIAGTTGAGKSNAMNAALAHLVQIKTPADVNLLLIDPKRVDLLAFADLPHTTAHIPDMDAVADALEQLTGEVERRYKLFERARTKDLNAYNKKTDTPLPRVVAVIDEWGMLMDKHHKVIEPLMLELLQVARASGIHVILGTQRPDGDILKPRLRGNLPARVCFRVNDVRSSALIIDDPSAVGLLGAGDGLYRDSTGTLTRFQSPFIAESALEQVVNSASKHERIHTAPVIVNTTPTIDRSLSRFEQAKMLALQLEEIASSDLLEYEVATGKTVAKNLLNDLRKQGIIGEYDKSRKASPVRRQQSAPVKKTGQGGMLVTRKTTHQTPSPTVFDQSGQLISSGVSEVGYD